MAARSWPAAIFHKIPQERFIMNQKVTILPSIMCCTPDNTRDYVRAFEENGIDAIHSDAGEARLQFPADRVSGG